MTWAGLLHTSHWGANSSAVKRSVAGLENLGGPFGRVVEGLGGSFGEVSEALGGPFGEVSEALGGTFGRGLEAATQAT